jgi:hypothetical protein
MVCITVRVVTFTERTLPIGISWRSALQLAEAHCNLLVVIQSPRMYRSFRGLRGDARPFAPGWCIEIELASQERRWPMQLFAFRIAKSRGDPRNQV